MIRQPPVPREVVGPPVCIEDRDGDPVQAGRLALTMSGAGRVRQPLYLQARKKGTDKVLHRYFDSGPRSREVIVEVTSNHHQVSGRCLETKESPKDRSLVVRGKVEVPETDRVRTPASNHLQGTARV